MNFPIFLFKFLIGIKNVLAVKDVVLVKRGVVKVMMLVERVR